jgi:tetratricopeptide (TPR) repeat protein
MSIRPLVAFLLLASCALAENGLLIEAQQQFDSAKFLNAERFARLALEEEPQSEAATVLLIRSLMEQKKFDEAVEAGNRAAGKFQDSSPVAAVLGEAYFRNGQLSEAATEYRLALSADAKNAIAWSGLGHFQKAAGLPKSAYESFAKAHQFAPNDAGITSAWLHNLPWSERLAAMQAIMADPKSAPELRKLVEEQIGFYKQLGTREFFRLNSDIATYDIPLVPLYDADRRLRGFALQVVINGKKHKLLLDSGASGFYLSPKAARKLGLDRLMSTSIAGIGDKGPRAGHTAVAQSVRIGAVEFADCLVEVGDDPILNDDEDSGLIGTDVFDDFLITIEPERRVLHLSPLPKHPEAAPGRLNDAYRAPEFASFTRFYQFDHVILVSGHVNSGPVRLFMLDTGAFATSLDPSMKSDLGTVFKQTDLRVTGLSGEVERVGLTSAAHLDFGRFTELSSSFATFDLSRFSDDAGVRISGIVGFARLKAMAITIDYRDHLIGFNAPAPAAR